jgi:regulatory protein
MKKSTENIYKKISLYCSYQERSHKEVLLKISKSNISKNETDKIVTKLITENFLNETRYAIAYARGKFRIKNWGKIKIINKLKQQNISSWNIKKAIDEIDKDEYSKTFNFIFNKLNLKYNYLKNIYRKKKILSILYSKGWEYDLIMDSLNAKFKKYN